MNKIKILFIYLFLIGIFGCTKKTDTLFEKLSPTQTGIDFSNDLSFSQDFNIFKYRNFYNGGGVALIDYNNDGLQDVYLIGNLKKNKLYKNLGNLKFEDVTESAGVSGNRAWSTGATAVDINADGWMDLYVCNSGDIKGDNKQNEFFINNGDGTFTDKAQELGLDDRGFSTHASFFDYDKDGDLDMYLLNNSYQAIGSFNLKKNIRPIRDSVGGDKLFKNENGKFLDVSIEAGIYGSVIGFGLGVTVGDVNKDGWLDIYVSNDFFERDYLYLNNKKGGFDEVLEKCIKSICGASMGADMADLNNDGWSEIFVTEMLPKTNERIKTVTTFEDWDKYQYNVSNNYYHQFTRNTLQLNNGDGTFSEIGRLAGVEASDWSWGALIFDFQNDGLKDIFISNGIFQDLTNQDFLFFASQDDVIKQVVNNKKVDYKKLISFIPSQPIPNQGYINENNLKFTEKNKELGFEELSFSSGAAYGDLDNDGDLDLIINNTNMESFVYKNNSNINYPNNHFLTFELKGENKNLYAFGTKISVYAQNNLFYIEQLPTRGFQSTVDIRPLLGVGQYDIVDSIVVVWPTDKVSKLFNVKTNQKIQLSEKDASYQLDTVKRNNSTPLFKEENFNIDYKHTENQFVDFDRDRLLFQMYSTTGPCLCTGDINKDGLEDFYVGGALGQAGKLFVQQSNGDFTNLYVEEFEKYKNSDEVNCAFFDANGDGYLDLYVNSGGSELVSSIGLADKLFINEKGKNFTKQDKFYPTSNFENTSVVAPADFDNDGDIDLLVGVKQQNYFYGRPANVYLLQNDGNANFEDVSQKLAPELTNIGMTTDAIWVDIDNDSDLDFIVVGEWMPIKIFENKNGSFTYNKNVFNQELGWWNAIEIADFNNDNLPDLVLANHGLNSRFKASSEKNIQMFINDFDKNGFIEQIICQYNGEKSYPLALRHDLSKQMPFIKKKYLKYENFKDQTIYDIFGEKSVNESQVLSVNELKSVVFINKGNFTFQKIDLPKEVQYSCFFDILIDDYNNDNQLDILFGGNLYNVKPEMGRYDASFGVMLLGDGNGDFSFLPNSKSGIYIDKQVRKIKKIKSGNGSKILVANNNDIIQVFSKNE